MFAALGRFIYKRRWFVLVAGLVFLIASGVYGTTLFGVLKGGGFYDPDSESIKVAFAMHDKLGRDDGALIVLFTSNDGTKVDSPQYKQAIETTLAKVEGKEGVGKI